MQASSECHTKAYFGWPIEYALLTPRIGF